MNQLCGQLQKLESYFKKGSRLYELNVEQAFRVGSSSSTFRQSPLDLNNEEMFNEYLVKFYQVLFSQFKSKKDNFKINEQVLMDVHETVKRESSSHHTSTRLHLQTHLLQQQHQHFFDEINRKIDLVGEDGGVDLLTKFELYAECVHKYLPQIRQHNKYLLFHYIWTMQVQYLTPFFNYICDLYQAYD